MRLRVLRGMKLLTAKRLAELSGVSRSTIHAIERGRNVPTFDVIQKLSAALEVDPLEVDEFADAIRRRTEDA
jgi:transcriptional regulator with XRE-family HTH domain